MSSLRARLLFAAGLILILFIIFTGLALEHAFHRSARQAERDRLQGLVYALIGATDIEPGFGVQVSKSELPDDRWFVPGSGLFLAIINDKDELSWTSPSFPERQSLSIRTGVGEWKFAEVTEFGLPLFSLALGVNWSSESGDAGRYTFLALEDKRMFNHRVSIFQRALLIWLLIAASLLLVALVLVLRWGLAPLGLLADDLKAIEDGQKESLSRVYPHELVQLTMALNHLLDHERSRQTRYRNALDDLAHSLKTPLAVMRGAIDELSLHNDNFLPLVEQIDRIDEIVSYQLGKAVAIGGRVFTAGVALRPLLAKVISALTKVYQDKGIDYKIDVPAEVILDVDIGDLMELLGNLLDNASKWCRTYVRIWIENSDHAVRLYVDDDGPGFPEKDKNNLLWRGERADSRPGGQGIGLSVVVGIMGVYNGEVILGHSDSNGARVTLVFSDS